jgi:hypothetical protein
MRHLIIMHRDINQPIAGYYSQQQIGDHIELHYEGGSELEQDQLPPFTYWNNESDLKGHEVFTN